MRQRSWCRRRYPLPEATRLRSYGNRKRLAAANIKLENDRQQYERYKNLYDQNAISASNYEKYQAACTRPHQKKSAASNSNCNNNACRLHSIATGNQSIAACQYIKGNGLIKSFSDGIVYEILSQTGDMIYPNQPIALVGSGKMIAKLLVDEDDFQKVKEGQKVLITMDAYPGKTFRQHCIKFTRF